MDSTNFLNSLRATARLKASDIAETRFFPSDLLIQDEMKEPPQPGIALSYAKTVATLAADAAFDLGRQAERELQLMQSTPIRREDAADRQQQRAGEGGQP